MCHAHLIHSLTNGLHIICTSLVLLSLHRLKETPGHTHVLYISAFLELSTTHSKQVTSDQ